jgi:hypothetical protein
MVRRRMGGGWERGRIIQGNAKSRFGRAKLIDFYGDAVHHGRASYGAYLIGVHLTGVYLNAAFGGRWCFILILALSGNLTQTVPRALRSRGFGFNPTRPDPSRSLVSPRTSRQGIQ